VGLLADLLHDLAGAIEKAGHADLEAVRGPGFLHVLTCPGDQRIEGGKAEGFEQHANLFGQHGARGLKTLEFLLVGIALLTHALNHRLDHVQVLATERLEFGDLAVGGSEACRHRCLGGLDDIANLARHALAHVALARWDDVLGQFDLERQQPALLEQRMVGLDLAEQALLRRYRKHLPPVDSRARAVSSAWRAMLALTAASSRSSSHSVSILLSTAMQPLWPAPRAVLRCRCQTSMSDLVTPVSAASRNSTACALGSMLMVSSGSVPKAFRPGVSSTTKPCFSSGFG